MTLARRAVASPRWRWMPGMALLGKAGRHRRMGDHWLCAPNAAWAQSALPDLDDAASLGCLLALVREAWDGDIVINQGNGWWEVENGTGLWNQDNTASFVEALVLALEVAP